MRAYAKRPSANLRAPLISRSPCRRKGSQPSFPRSHRARKQQGLLHEVSELNSEVVNLYLAGEYSQALPFAEKACDICKRVLGEEGVCGRFALQVG